MTSLQIASKEILFMQQLAGNMDKHESGFVRRAIAHEKNKTIKNLTPEEFVILLAEIQTTVTSRLGLRKEEIEQYASTTVLLNRDLLRKFPLATENEVRFALEKGLDGRYSAKVGSVFFNPSNFVQWLDCYMEEKVIPMQHFAQLAAREYKKEEPERTQEESLLNRFEILYNALQLTIHGGKFDDMGNVVFDLLLITVPDFVDISPFGDNAKMAWVQDFLEGIASQGEESALNFINDVRLKVKEIIQTL